MTLVVVDSADKACGGELNRQETTENSRIAKLRNILRIILPLCGLVQLGAIIFISARPLVSIILGCIAAALLAAIVILDRNIVRMGGASFWKDGRFRDPPDT